VQDVPLVASVQVTPPFAESFATVAVNCCEFPTRRFAAAGAIETEIVPPPDDELMVMLNA
jgi:hypothetical protein